MKTLHILSLITSSVFSICFLVIWALSVEFSEWGMESSKEAFLSLIFGIFVIIYSIINIKQKN